MVMNNNTKVVFNAKGVGKALNELEPGLKNKMIREFKSESADMVKDMSSVIRSLNPPVGMLNHNGRTSWEHSLYKGKTVKPDNVLARYTTGRSRKFAVTSLFGVWVRNPAVSITGTIGKGSMVSRRAVTREYEWRGTTRTHKNNGQGRGLLKAVRHNKDNWFYAAAEKSMPDVERKIKLIWERYSAMVSRKIK
jgi:hypothetical protein